MDMLKSVHIEGFKSIRDATIDLGPLTVLIGANGSGKSNFVSLLRMMQSAAHRDLQRFVATAGGADTLLYFGSSATRRLHCEASFELHGAFVQYGFTLGVTEDDALTYFRESLPGFRQPKLFSPAESDAPSGRRETAVLGLPGDRHHWAPVVSAFVTGSQAYHFHDTSTTAGMRKQVYVNDNRALHADGGNLAAYLYMLRETRRPYYDRIVSAFRMAAPFFDDFVLAPMELNPENIRLDWRETGHDQVFGPHQLSDGSLRTIALLTLLLQPEERLPSLMIVDEPELGLHPYVITMVANLLRAVSNVCQVIVATQSVTFLNHFDPEEIVVVERDRDGGSVFNRLSEEALAGWLEDYAIGELWLKNVIGGRP